MLVCMITENSKLVFGEIEMEEVQKMHIELQIAKRQEGCEHTVIAEMESRGKFVALDVLIPMICWKDYFSEVAKLESRGGTNRPYSYFGGD